MCDAEPTLEGRQQAYRYLCFWCERTLRSIMQPRVREGIRYLEQSNDTGAGRSQDEAE